MEREDVNISGNWEGKTLSKHLMDKYDDFCGKDFLREEEYREKIVLLCKNKKFDLNKDDGHGTFLGWACDKGYSKVVKSLLTLPSCNSDHLTADQLSALEKLRE